MADAHSPFHDLNDYVAIPRMAWYQTVFAFLGQHVLGEDWARPDLL